MREVTRIITLEITHVFKNVDDRLIVPPVLLEADRKSVESSLKSYAAADDVTITGFQIFDRKEEDHATD